jgi:hypothetical protein
MKRWEPFDAAAWDSFFVQMAAAIETCLRVLRGCHQTLKTYPAELSESVSNLLARAEQKCLELSKMRDQAALEFDLFNNWFMTRLRRESFAVSAAVRAIQRALVEQPGVVPLGFLADLDALATHTDELDRLVELFKKPEVIDRMLMDKDLLAGRPLPRDEAAWNSVWDEMSKVLGIFANQLLGRVQKLKSHPLEPSAAAAKIAEQIALLETIPETITHILLEMTDLTPLASPSGDPK